MATAFASIDLPATPDQMWQLIGGFDSLPDWLPYIPASTLSEGGRVRTLVNPAGQAIVERVLGAGAGARVEWPGEFTPDGVSDEEASRLFGAIYLDGLDALAQGCQARSSTRTAAT